ncbi:MAG: hypothetical protein ABI363_04615, partial [Nitrosospira sp.]
DVGMIGPPLIQVLIELLKLFESHWISFFSVSSSWISVCLRNFANILSKQFPPVIYNVGHVGRLKKFSCDTHSHG